MKGRFNLRKDVLEAPTQRTDVDGLKELAVGELTPCSRKSAFDHGNAILCVKLLSDVQRCITDRIPKRIGPFHRVQKAMHNSAGSCPDLLCRIAVGGNIVNMDEGAVCAPHFQGVPFEFVRVSCDPELIHFDFAACGGGFLPCSL